MPWTDREPSPECICGAPTCVIVDERGLASILCIFHTNEAGAFFPLPKDRPEKWPDLSNEELAALVDEGAAYHERFEREHG